ncbi:hypothetical protein N9X61_02970 [Sulfurimonas sp.]|nr:hypothetical protein [Sulfurimonas sp.]
MFKIFEHADKSCDVLLEPPLRSVDVTRLREILKEKYVSWHIEFGRIYKVEKEIIDLMYKEIFLHSKNITITTHKSKLNSYLQRLGFQSKFVSLEREDVIEVSNVEVVLIGGSADSTQKIIEIVKAIQLENLSLVIVQHVEEKKEGYFDRVLQAYTKRKVKYAKDGEKLLKSSVYIAPSDYHLTIENGCFCLADTPKYNFSKPSVSVSYASFSSYYKEKLLVIQECGYASDGVDKLPLLKTNNTHLIIHKEVECEAKPMVSNALALNIHDYVLGLGDIIHYVDILDKELSKDNFVEYFLEKVYQVRAYDFRLYSLDMMKRRIDIFMLKHEMKSIKDAIAIILFKESAFKSFFLEVSINVTELFRKVESFILLSNLLESQYNKSRNIKIWSAGCSSGEEAYSVAILLENLNLLDRSVVYATDFNDVVLQEAENGFYANKYLKQAITNYERLGFKNNLDQYFTKNNNYISVNENIRKKVLFFQHNLVLDSSFNEFDIIICKNVLIYFNSELQNLVFGLFYDSLKFGGHLVLGESEMLCIEFLDKFERCSNDCKIFRKIA